MRWRRTFVAMGALGVLGAGVLATAAAGDVTTPPGVCVGTATFTTGTGNGGFSVDSTQLAPGDVTEVPIGDTVNWSAKLVGVPAAPREIKGFIRLDMPAPLPDITLGSWNSTSSMVANQGVKEYSLPSATPRGVVMNVYGLHMENGQVLCKGSAKVKVAGGAFSSPAPIVSLALLALSAAALGLAGKGHTVLGAFSGLGLGLFLGTTLMLLGMVPLNSPLLTVLPVIGLIAGIAFGKWAPFKPSAPAPTEPPVPAGV